MPWEYENDNISLKITKKMVILLENLTDKQYKYPAIAFPSSKSLVSKAMQSARQFCLLF